jgi:hypothetical protein
MLDTFRYMEEQWGLNVKQNTIHDSDDKPFHQTSRSRGRMVFSGQDNVFCVSEDHLKGICAVVDKVKEPDRQWKDQNFIWGKIMLKTEAQVRKHVMKFHHNNGSVVSIAIGKNIFNVKIDHKAKEGFINAVRQLVQKVCEDLKIEYKGEW